MTKHHIVILIVAAWSQSAIANQANAMLKQMTESDRAAAFQRVVQSSGDSCASVTKTFYQGVDKSGHAYWNIACGKRAYSIQVQNNSTGSTRVTDCAVLKSVGAACFKAF